MKQEHEIVEKVYAAKGNSTAANELVCQYLPFIKTEVARFIHRPPREGEDDELSIAMFAFHEAVLAYHRTKGAFLPFASLAIHHRLIDYVRKEQRSAGLLSLDEPLEQDNGEAASLLDKLDTGNDNVSAHERSAATKEELLEFSNVLASYGISLTDVADSCPKQERTLHACHRGLAYAKTHPELFTVLASTKKLPISQLVQGCNVERKTLERHRDYMIAILLAYTNGFEIIRNHLNQISIVKGGRS